MGKIPEVIHFNPLYEAVRLVVFMGALSVNRTTNDRSILFTSKTIVKKTIINSVTNFAKNSLNKKPKFQILDLLIPNERKKKETKKN